MKLYVLEATGVNGVDIFSWDLFIQNNFHLMYEELAMRHLHSVNGQAHAELRNDRWLRTLEDFIKTQKGKKYRLNPMDLFKSQASDKPNKKFRSASEQPTHHELQMP